jgi:hypothetical protein
MMHLKKFNILGLQNYYGQSSIRFKWQPTHYQMQDLQQGGREG